MFIRAIFIFLISCNLVFAFSVADKRVEQEIWQEGETFLAFLEDNFLPLKLYYNLDEEDEKIISDIRAGTNYHILRDQDYMIEQVLIPLNDELQIHITKENGKYSLKLIPIIYQEKDRVLVLKVNSVISNDILKQSGNFDLAVEVEQKFKAVVDFKSLHKGDDLVVFYRQKTRLGKLFATPIIQAAMLEHNSKKRYIFLAKDGKYYDQFGKSTLQVTFITPLRYKRVSSKFTKKRWHPILKKYRAHHGIDYAAPIGTKVKATYSGRVTFKGLKGGYGKCIIITHPNGYKSLYAHLSKYKKSLKKGSKVKKGEVIAYVGNTGKSTGPHLHFGLSKKGRWINPASKIIIAKSLKAKDKKLFLENVKLFKAKIKLALEQNQSYDIALR